MKEVLVQVKNLSTAFKSEGKLIKKMCIRDSVKIIGDEAVAASNLISGDLDMIDVVSQPAVVSQISNAQGCQIKINAPREVFHLYMNMEPVSYTHLINSSACASRHASFSCSSVASGLPQRRFSLIVPEKSTFFCSTTAT